jgi:F-type H+-transporting ATPase subunit a
MNRALYLLLVLVFCFSAVFAVAQENSAEVPARAPEAEAASSRAQHESGVEAAAHKEEAAEAPELPSIITILLNTRVGGTEIRDTGFGYFLHTYEKQIMMILMVALLSIIIFGTLGLRHNVPGKLQALLEMIVDGIYSFFLGILGEDGRKYIPFLGSLFVFILVSNLMGIIPFCAAATSKFQTTVTLAIIVFFYVNYHGIKEGGIKHFLWHLAGSPKDALGWTMMPLMFPLELIGMFAKPLSLSLRLFGNVMGEDILIGVFLMLGMGLMGIFWHNPLVGVPLHLPFLFLALLTSTIQALVFALLSAIYILLVLPHHEHEHHEESNPHEVHHPEHPGLPDDPTPHIGVNSAPFVG